jgi:cytochrome c
MKKVLYVAACVLSVATLTLSAHSVQAANIDVGAAKTLFDDNECSRCHSIDKTKKGPSLKKIALKYKGKPDAEDAMIKHLKAGAKVKLEDGSMDDHKIIEAKDEAQIKNLVRWILSL